MQNVHSDHRAQTRQCRTCSLCCFTHGVSPRQGESFRKEESKWCEHRAIGTGCKIYETRPIACREFVCGWLTGLGTDEGRPDRTHVVMHRFRFGDHAVVLKMVESATDAFQSPEVQQVIQEQILAGDIVSLHYFSGAKDCFVRDGVSVPLGIQIELMEKKIPIKRVT